MINWNLKILDPSGNEFVDVLDSFQRMFPDLLNHGISLAFPRLSAKI